ANRTDVRRMASWRQCKRGTLRMKPVNKLADYAGCLACCPEHLENFINLVAGMLRAERTSQQGHSCRSRRRPGKVHVEALVKQRLPHRRALLEIRHDDGDDRRLRL